MPVCKKHQINHGHKCPQCEENVYHGMQTSLLKVGKIHHHRVNGKAIEGEKPLERPAVSRP